jgi:hypothetical protein
LLTIRGSTVQRRPLAVVGRSLRGADNAVIVVTSEGEQRVALP